MSLRFEKYHGIGNDFLVVEVTKPDDLSPQRAIWLCDRHFGVGGDGVLLVSPSQTGRARMTVLNADGSRPEMCGNGLRCVALFLARQGAETRSEFVVETDAGPRLCQVELAPSRRSASVRTSMGTGRLGADFAYSDGPDSFQFHRVSMGNPHAVCFREPISDVRLDAVGEAVSGLEPGGTNVEIVTQRGPRELDVAVWERGVGRTLACGTGAVGTVVVAAQMGRVPFGEPVQVRLPGGVVTVTVQKNLETSFEGPAEFVFAGQVELGER